MKKFPRLGYYPYQASQEELVKYVEELIEWASEAEEQLLSGKLTSKEK